MKKYFSFVLCLVLCFMLFAACKEKVSKEQLAQEFIKAALPSPSPDFVQLEKVITQASESGDAKKIEDIQNQSNALLKDALIALCGDYVDHDKLDGNGNMVTKLSRMQFFAITNQYTYTVQEVTTEKTSETIVSYEAKIAVSIPEGVLDYFQNTSEVTEITLFGNIQFNKDNKIDFFTVEQKKLT